VVSAGLGQNVARQAAMGSGPRPCHRRHYCQQGLRSGLKAVMLAAQAIQCGDAEAIVAGGTENMSRAPICWKRRAVANAWAMANWLTR